MEMICISWNTSGTNASFKWNDENHIAKDVQPKSKYSCYSLYTYCFPAWQWYSKKFGINATIIHLSGHTNDSIGIDIDNTYLVAGDTLMNIVYSYASLLYTDKQALRQSCNKIYSLGNRTVYFGHGRPAKNKTWTVT